MDKNSTPNGSQEQGKKSGNEGLQEKGQAGSEALSLLQNSDGEILDLKDYKATFEFYSWQYRLPEVSGFRMGRRV